MSTIANGSTRDARDSGSNSGSAASGCCLPTSTAGTTFRAARARSARRQLEPLPRPAALARPARRSVLACAAPARLFVAWSTFVTGAGGGANCCSVGGGGGVNGCSADGGGGVGATFAGGGGGCRLGGGSGFSPADAEPAAKPNTAGKMRIRTREGLIGRSKSLTPQTPNDRTHERVPTSSGRYSDGSRKVKPTAARRRRSRRCRAPKLSRAGRPCA